MALKSLDVFASSLKQKFGDYGWEWVLRTRDNSGRNIKLDQPGFIDRPSEWRLQVKQWNLTELLKRCQKFV